MTYHDIKEKQALHGAGFHLILMDADKRYIDKDGRYAKGWTIPRADSLPENLPDYILKARRWGIHPGQDTGNYLFFDWDKGDISKHACIKSVMSTCRKKNTTRSYHGIIHVTDSEPEFLAAYAESHNGGLPGLEIFHQSKAFAVFGVYNIDTAKYPGFLDCSVWSYIDSRYATRGIITEMTYDKLQALKIPTNDGQGLQNGQTIEPAAIGAGPACIPVIKHTGKILDYGHIPAAGQANEHYHRMAYSLIGSGYTASEAFTMMQNTNRKRDQPHNERAIIQYIESAIRKRDAGQLNTRQQRRQYRRNIPV